MSTPNNQFSHRKEVTGAAVDDTMMYLSNTTTEPNPEPNPVVEPGTTVVDDPVTDVDTTIVEDKPTDAATTAPQKEYDCSGYCKTFRYLSIGIQSAVILLLLALAYKAAKSANPATVSA